MLCLQQCSIFEICYYGKEGTFSGSQKRYSEAETVLDAALDETGKWEQGVLLRTKAKLQIAQSSPMNAIETYKLSSCFGSSTKEELWSWKMHSKEAAQE